jgi:acyl-CoA synthetase (AMP-forming)/AMP-acid ligase II/surfactin synthase thioesterase subunit
MTTSLPLQRFGALLKECPDAPLFTWVDDQGQDQITLSVRQIAAAAEGVAAHLTGSGIRPGNPVLLVYPPGLEVVPAFLGCLLAGVLPAPVVPPHPLKLASDLAAFEAIAADLYADGEAGAVLTSRAYGMFRQSAPFRQAAREGTRCHTLPWHVTDAVESRGPFPWHEPVPDDVALLQYTSGSTGLPRGVLITHANIASETTSNAADLGLRRDGRAVLWLPAFHSFCLINGILNALVGHGRLYLMSPQAFLARPGIWPEVMSRVRATHSAAANFALQLAVKATTPEQRSAWDLSALEGIVCSAEPVREATLRAFSEAFASSGLRRGALRPAYGLSEHTVSVTVSRGDGAGRRLQFDPTALSEGRVVVAEDGVVLVGNGLVSKQGGVVRIVDPETRRVCPPDRIGEIWVDSPSKAAGYHGKPELSAEVFQARIEGEAGRTYLRTGDLGFQHDGELFVTGRLKELIIVRGGNYHPHDLEDALHGCHPAVRPLSPAAFSTADAQTGTEAVVVAAEVLDEGAGADVAREVARAIRARLSRTHQLDCRHVVIFKPNGLPRTGSGKIRRRECAALFEGGRLASSPLTLAVIDLAGSVGPDPRLVGLTPEFERLIADLGRRFAAYGKARGGRAFHLRGTTLAGVLEVAPDPALPAHAFFAPGLRYPVLVRHANGTQEDDAAIDNRGATVRVLDPLRPEDLDRPLLDLLLTTGRCFIQATAAGFARWIAATPAQREAWAREQPHLSEAAWEMYRRAESFATLFYYSKTAGRFIGTDGDAWFARTRLVPADGAPDHGFVTPDGRTLPPEVMRRNEGDTRPPTFLHDDLRARLRGGCVAYRLQMQVRRATDSPAAERALDCTRPWPEAEFPWRDVGRLTLDRMLPNERVEALAFNPRHAPPDLGLITARDPASSASLNHLRSLVYDLTSCARTGTSLPAGLAELIARVGPSTGPATVSRPPSPPSPRRVCVVGGGASGLTAARELERRGYQVTVFERAATPAGKCASVQIEGDWYDLGGHFCSANYRTLWRLVQELGIETEPAFVGRPYDLAARCFRTFDDPAALGSHWLEYVRARDRDFPGLTRPGFGRIGRALAAPAGDWLAATGLDRFARTPTITFTASGYGYLTNPELPALYFLKAVETALGAAPGGAVPEAWTIKGGFLRLWEKVAVGLRDVRLGVEVRAVERGPGGVTVHTANGTHEFDALVVATPLHETPPYLDASGEERAIFGRVRHRDYSTTIIRATGLPERGFFFLTPTCTDASLVGRPVALHHRYPGDVYLAYANGVPGQDGEEVTRLHEDVARMGGRITSVLGRWQWAYFPHFCAGDVADGIHDRLEALQGNNRTFYLGSLLNFELVECNVAYAADLVDRFFPVLPGVQVPEPADRAQVPVPHSGSRQVVLERMRVLVGEELETPELPPAGAAFAELGLDSLRAMGLLQRLSREVGLSLLPTAFVDYPTLDALAVHLASAANGKSASPAPEPAADGRPRRLRLVPLRPTPRVRLFCFHHAGGGGEAFARWPDLLPREIEVRALQMPGCGDRGGAARCADLDELLTDLESELGSLLDRPFAFFGHSMGALVAFELTRRLRKAGKPLPFQLLLSAFRAPGDTTLPTGGGEVGERFLAPEAVSDLRLVRAWRHSPEEPLDVPILALGGEDDPVCPPAGLSGWRNQTRAGFELRLFPGGHFYTREREAELLTVVTQVIASRSAADGPTDPDLARLASAWCERRASFAGSLARYDLAWVARVADEAGRPLFPEALAALRTNSPSHDNSPLPASDFIASLAVANTLLRWGADEATTGTALAAGFRAVARMGSPPTLEAPQHHGRHFHFGDLFGPWITAVTEVERLLAHPGSVLSEDNRAVLEGLVAPYRDSPARRAFDRLDHARCFRGNAPILYFAEAFPAQAFHTPEARAHARAVGDLPGLAAPAAACYAEATRDPLVIARLRTLLRRPEEGLWPPGALPELVYALDYLLRGGVDICRFPQQADRLAACARSQVVGPLEGSTAPDVDITALALGLCHVLGLPVGLHTEALEQFWNPAHECYLGFDGRPAASVCAEIHVLDAYLRAQDVSEGRRRDVWRRTVRLLESRPWHEKAHVSPFFVWELIVGLGFCHGPRFPDDPTRVHFEALEQILAHQTPAGGFRSAYLASPCVEESSLALLGLRSALHGLPAGELCDRVRTAARACREYLLRERAAGPARHPELWVGKLLAAPTNQIEAITLAALAGPV